MFWNQKIYAAYGSNLNLEQMLKRTNATVICEDEIEGYELEFSGPLNVVSAKNKSIKVGLYSVGFFDRLALDRYEQKYKRINVKTKSGKDVSMYVMKEKRNRKSPSPQYFNVVMEGYKNWNFDTKPLIEAKTKSS